MENITDNCGNCHKCLEGTTTEHGIPITMTRMLVCPICHNKRCPKATDHTLACSGSNAIGQVGKIDEKY
jgi:hypothetical protein